MNILDAFKLAFQNLTHKKVRSWLTLIGIFTGIAAVVALISLGQGLQNAVNEQFNSIGTDKFTIKGAGGGFGPPGTNAVGTLTDKDIRLIEEIQGVKIAGGRYFKSAIMEVDNEKKAVFISSIPREYSKAELVKNTYNFDIEEGRNLEYKDKNKIFLGATIADFDGNPIIVGQKILINDKLFSVIGIAKKKGNPIFDTTILITEKDMDDLIGLDGNYGMIGVQIKQGFDLNEIVGLTENKLRKDRHQKIGEEDFEITTPQEFLDSVNNILIVVQILLIGIATISLIVGGIGIANTMYTSVLERNREIGIMKAIGAKNKEILTIFMIESGLLGLTGGLIGLILGIIIAKGVEYGAYASFGESILKATFSPALIIGALIFAFVLGAISGTLPAQQAAKLKPVDALRK